LSNAEAGTENTRASEGVSVAIGSKPQTLSDGLVGYWKMDETATTSGVVDSSGNGNDGTYVGDASTTAGKYGRGGDFDGSGDYIEISQNSSINLSTNGSFSFGYWIKVDTLTNFVGTIMKGGFQSSYGHLLWTDGSLRAYYSGGSYIEVPSLTTGKIGSWLYITQTYDGDKIRIYRDGDLFFTSSGEVTLETSTDPLYFGVSSGNQYSLDGQMDEVRVYNRALSANEVAQLYEYAPGPVLHLKMDEKVKGDAQTLYDTSGNENNGTTVDGANNTGMDCSQPGKYGSACEFGIDDYVNLGDDPAFNIENAITVSIWVKRYSKSSFSGWKSPISKGYDESYALKGLGTSIGWRLQLVGNGNTYIASPSLEEDRWYNLAGTYDGQIMIYYIDGVEYDRISVTDEIQTTSNPLTVGYDSYYQDYFNGKIDDVKIYNYARTQSQILEDMGSGPALGKPVLDLSFDEGYGATAHDASGNANHGTLVFGATGGNTTVSAMWDKGGKFGGAMEFDGVNDTVTISNFQFSISNQFSMSQYINIKTLAVGKPIIGEWGSSQNNLLLKLDDTNSDELKICIASSLTDACTIYGKTTDLNLTVNQWINAQVIYDGTKSVNADKLKLYIDGQKKTLSFTGTIPTTILSASTAGLTMGGNGGIYTNVILDEVKIYSYAISEDEIKALYNGSAMSMGGETASANNNGTTVTGAATEYCIPGDTAKCDKPVLELKLDEKSGTTAFDTSGNGNNGAINGAVWDRGKVGSALKFDGTNDYVDAGTSMDISSLPFTISAWVNPSSYADWRQIVAKRNSYGATTMRFNFGLYPSTGRVMLQNGTTTIISTYTPPLNQWTYLTVVPGATSTLFYANGQLKSTMGAFTLGTGSTARVMIGATDSGSVDEFLGQIDDVKIYNYARTPAQIAWDYNRGQPIAHWRFDEGEGVTAHDESGPPAGGGNHGAISGATWKDEDECKNGKCLYFDGNQDYVVANSTINPSLTDFTVSVWIKDESADSTQNMILDQMSGTGTGREILLVRGTNIISSNLGNSFRDSGVLTDKGNWKHIVFMHNNIANTTDWYIDGIYVASNSTVVANSADGDWTIGIGDDLLSSDFKGYMDDLKIYNYALTPEQVKLDYNGGAALKFE
jgi:hypothetical protein